MVIKGKIMNQDKLYSGQWFDLGRQIACHRSNDCGPSRAQSRRYMWFGLAAAAAGVRAGYQTVLPSPYGLSPGYVYGTPGYTMGAMGGVGAGVTSGAGGLVQLPQLQHAAAMAAANHLYEYQAAAAQGAAAYQQQYAAAGFDPYATAAAAAAAAASGGYMSPYYALPSGGVQAPLLPQLSYPPQLQEARMQ